MILRPSRNPFDDGMHVLNRRWSGPNALITFLLLLDDLISDHLIPNCFEYVVNSFLQRFGIDR